MNQDQAHRRVSRKRAVVIGLIVCAVIVVLSLMTASLDPTQLVEKWFGDGDQKENDIYFYAVDESLDIWSDADYAQLDHRVHYSDVQTGATYSLEQEDLVTAEPFARFFYNYFDCVIAGDAEGYALFFTDNYLSQNTLPEDFTPQMIYDIRITPYLAADASQGSAYLVDYKILRNNGTFRRDVGSNASRTLLIRLVEQAGELYIDDIVAYTQY